jgi:hypothetical protein
MSCVLQVFLLSTRAGAVGINLVAAQRLVLYDMHWNPVHNKQVRQQAQGMEQKLLDMHHYSQQSHISCYLMRCWGRRDGSSRAVDGVVESAGCWVAAAAHLYCLCSLY